MSLPLRKRTVVWPSLPAPIQKNGRASRTRNASQIVIFPFIKKGAAPAHAIEGPAPVLQPRIFRVGCRCGFHRACVAFSRFRKRPLPYCLTKSANATKFPSVGMANRQCAPLVSAQSSPTIRFSFASSAKCLPLYSTTRIRPSVSMATKSG